MTAWSAKVLSSSICRSVSGKTSSRVTVIAPIGSPVRSIGTESTVRNPASTMALDRLREHSRDGVELLRSPSVVSGEVDEGAIEAVDTGALDGAQPRGRGGDGIEDRLDIVWRTRDHAQDLAGCRLLFERLRLARQALG